MEIVKGNFKLISQPFSYINSDEYCIKEVADDKPQLYARKYNYVGFGKANIKDRVISIHYIITQVGDKKIIEIKEI